MVPMALFKERRGPDGVSFAFALRHSRNSGAIRTRRLQCLGDFRVSQSVVFDQSLNQYLLFAIKAALKLHKHLESFILALTRKTENSKDSLAFFDMGLVSKRRRAQPDEAKCCNILSHSTILS